MYSRIDQDQLAPYYEAELRKRGHQYPQSGFAGIGYWYWGYPTYIGGMGINGALTTVTYPQGDQAQPDADSKMNGAISEAGADTSGVNSGASGTAAN
jgi:hypothetical protein